MTVELTNADFEQEVVQSEIPVLVDFWAPWCGPCRMVGPILEEIAGEQDGKVKICKVNVDDEIELAQRFGVSSIPTLILFKNGQPAAQKVGAQPKAVLEELIRS